MASHLWVFKHNINEGILTYIKSSGDSLYMDTSFDTPYAHYTFIYHLIDILYLN